MRRREGTGRVVTKRNWELSEARVERGKRTGYRPDENARRDSHGLEDLDAYFGSSEKKSKKEVVKQKTPLRALDVNQSIVGQKRETFVPKKIHERVNKEAWGKRISIGEVKTSQPFIVPDHTKAESSLQLESILRRDNTQRSHSFKVSDLEDLNSATPIFVPRRTYKPTAISKRPTFLPDKINTQQNADQNKVQKTLLKLEERESQEESTRPALHLQSLIAPDAPVERNDARAREDLEEPLLSPQRSTESNAGLDDAMDFSATQNFMPQRSTESNAELDDAMDFSATQNFMSDIEDDDGAPVFSPTETPGTRASKEQILRRRISMSPPPPLSMPVSSPKALDASDSDDELMKPRQKSARRSFDTPVSGFVAFSPSSDGLLDSSSITSGTPAHSRIDTPASALQKPKVRLLKTKQAKQKTLSSVKRRKRRRTTVSSFESDSSEEDEDYDEVGEHEEESDAELSYASEERSQEDSEEEGLPREEGYIRRVRKLREQKDRYNIRPFPRERDSYSRRKRFPPLRFWEGERIQYRRGLAEGQTVSEAVTAGKPEFMVTPEPMPPRCVVDQGKRVTLDDVVKRRRTASSKPVLAPRWPKEVEFTDPESPVQYKDEVTGKEVQKVVVRSGRELTFSELPRDMELKFTRHDGRVVPAAAPVAGAAFDDDKFLSGLVNLPPLSSKPMENGMDHTMVFVVVEAQELAVGVKVNERVYRVSKGDQFWVPPRTSYSLQNYSEVVDAQVAFVSIKP